MYGEHLEGAAGLSPLALLVGAGERQVELFDDVTREDGATVAFEGRLAFLVCPRKVGRLEALRQVVVPKLPGVGAMLVENVGGERGKGNHALVGGDAALEAVRRGNVLEAFEHIQGGVVSLVRLRD